MNVLDFLMTSGDTGFYIAALDGRMTVVSANAPFCSLFGIGIGERLPEQAQLRKVLSLAVKQRQSVSGILIEEKAGEERMQLAASCYLAGKTGEAAYYAILYNVSSLYQSFTGQLLREKRKLIGDMAAGTANSILNPLAVVRGSLQMIEGTLRMNASLNKLADMQMTQNVEQFVALATEQIKEISNYVNRWIHLGKPFHIELRPVLVSAFLESYVPAVQKEALRRGISFACEYPGRDGQMLVDPHYLREVLNEFVKNSFESTPQGGAVRLAVELSDLASTVTIRDSGGGIDEEMLKQVKEPFFTTKESSIGLGLNFCEVVLQRMGGAFEIEGGAPEGTEVRITLPNVPPVL